MVNQYKRKIRRFDCAVKIVILDDELEFSKILDKKIKEYCARKDLLYDCQIFSSSKNLLEDDLSSIQVAFLDIDMPEINGLDVAKVLHQRYPEMILVFVTSFIKYAPSGYKVNAFRYLLKTQLDEELSDCMDRRWILFICKHMGCSSPFSYFISIQERIFLIHGKSSRVLLNMLWSKMRGAFNCCYNRVTRKKAISIQKHYLA